ncbi:hypothetical protein JW905_10505 [bacterium]|nr:hypothetical protein [candidate division CSSED10-310 bacterium]
MALVNLLQFSPDTGAIISDEEFWNVHFRKRLYADNLQLLLQENMARDWKMEVVYGGVGYPSVHHEVVRDTRRALARLYSEKKVEGGQPTLIKDIATIAFKNLQTAIRRRIDQKLTFFFGFSSDDLNRGYYLVNGKKIEIKNEKIKENATGIASGEKADALLKAAMESKAVIFGFDETYGITAYHLSIENWVMGYIHEGFEAIGAGKYASGLVLGQDFGTKVFKVRKAGYGIGEGILELFESAVTAADHFKEVGGNLNLILLNRRGATRAEQVFELVDHRARLATEVVRACKAELLEKSKACALMEEIVTGTTSLQETEKNFLGSVNDLTRLHFLLRNYKLGDTDTIKVELDDDHVKVIEEFTRGALS